MKTKKEVRQEERQSDLERLLNNGGGFSSDQESMTLPGERRRKRYSIGALDIFDIVLFACVPMLLR